MLNFLKRFGLGILYIVVSPFLLLFLVLWTLYTTVIFVIELFSGIKSFFKGKKFFQEFPEDIEAKKILNFEQYNSQNTSDNNQQEGNKQQ